MVKNFITAEEARNITKTTQKPLNILFKRIKEEADYGICAIDHCVNQYDPVIIENMITVLREAKFKVTELTDESGRTEGLKINW